MKPTLPAVLLALLTAAATPALPAADPAVGALTLEPTRALATPRRALTRWEQAEAQRQAAELTEAQAARAAADLLAAHVTEGALVFASVDADAPAVSAPAPRPARVDWIDAPAAPSPAADLSPVPSVADLAVHADASTVTVTPASRRVDAAVPALLDARTTYAIPAAPQRSAESFAAGFAIAAPVAPASSAFLTTGRSVALGSGVTAGQAVSLAGAALRPASLPTPAVVTTNLVTNPGFETTSPAFYGYTVTPVNGNTVVQLSGYAHTGTQSADFSGETAGAYATLTQNISTTSGTLYTVSFYLEAIYTDSTGGGFRASFGNTTLLNITNTSNFPYTLETYNVLATSSSTALSFGGYNVDGNYELDDLSVSVAIPEPGTWAGGALLVGAAALTLRRRLRRA